MSFTIISLWLRKWYMQYTREFCHTLTFCSQITLARELSSLCKVNYRGNVVTNRYCFLSLLQVLVMIETGSGFRVRVPTRTGKPGKMGSHFPVREKSGNFEQTGKVRENQTKYWKTWGIWDKYYLIFLVIFKWTVNYLLKWSKFSVKKTKH